MGEPTGDRRSFWLTAIQYAFFALIGLGILVFIVTSLSGKTTILGSIERIEVARGLITFLIAVATVAIAIILALAAILSGGQEYKERFALGKEILTILIGVLGTIVGFYFGSSVKPQTEPINAPIRQAQALQVVPAVLSKEQPRKGETITISSFVSGGKPPYTYTIIFDPSDISPIKDAISQDGYIKQDILIPATMVVETEVKFQIDVKDSEGKTISYNKDGAKKFQVKSQ
jgi:hypothetical protein